MYECIEVAFTHGGDDDKMKDSQANRGMAFEQLIDFVNARYQQMGVAQIDKVPTPVKVLRIKNGRIRDGFYEKKGTVDYFGTYRGKSIIFDAKSTKSPTRFDLKNVHEHQVNHLIQSQKAGATSFLLVEFDQHQTVYLMPLQMLLYYWSRRNHQVRGSRSISINDFDVYALRVNPSKRVPLDYLATIEQVWEMEKEVV